MIRADRSPRIAKTLVKLENTSAQLGVRIAIAVLLLFTAKATELGFEAILGAFVAGAVLRVADRREYMIHAEFRRKIEAIGYGFLIPVFFVNSGMSVGMRSWFRRPEHLILVPRFLLALLVVRSLPALFYTASSVPGLLSVVLFPAFALRLLGDTQGATIDGVDAAAGFPPDVNPEPDAIA